MGFQHGAVEERESGCGVEPIEGLIEDDVGGGPTRQLSVDHQRRELEVGEVLLLQANNSSKQIVVFITRQSIPYIKATDCVTINSLPRINWNNNDNFK